MATIRASCPDCGDVEFTTRDVQVRVSAPDGSGTYAFSCPGCAVTVVKAAETRTIDLLLASGVAGPPADLGAFRDAVAAACLDLAMQRVGDAEGHTKVVEVHVTGADGQHLRAPLAVEPFLEHLRARYLG